MARPRDPELRARVLAAAAAEFAERGYAAASLAAIGRRAGVTKGGVYFHFRSKEELFWAVVDRWRRGLREALAAAGGEGSARSALQGFLAAFLAHHFGDRDAAGVVRVLATELRGHFTTQVREDLRGVLRLVRARIRETLLEGGRDGSLFAADPAFAAFLIAAAAEGAVQQWLAAPEDAAPFCDPQALADALVAPWATGAAPRDTGSRGGGPVGEEEFLPPF